MGAPNGGHTKKIKAIDWIGIRVWQYRNVIEARVIQYVELLLEVYEIN